MIILLLVYKPVLIDFTSSLFSERNLELFITLLEQPNSNFCVYDYF